MMTDGMSNWKESFTAMIPIRDLDPCRAEPEILLWCALLYKLYFFVPVKL